MTRTINIKCLGSWRPRIPRIQHMPVARDWHARVCPLGYITLRVTFDEQEQIFIADLSGITFRHSLQH